MIFVPKKVGETSVWGILYSNFLQRRKKGGMEKGGKEQEMLFSFNTFFLIKNTLNHIINQVIQDSLLRSPPDHFYDALCIIPLIQFES